MAKLEMEMKVLAGAESKTFLVELTKQIDRLEVLLKGVGKQGKVAKVEEKADDDVADDEDDEEFKPKKTTKKKPAFEDDADDEDKEEEDDADDEEDEEEEDDAPKSKKPKKVTLDDVNDACKARAAAGGKKGRAEVLAILKKKFKTETVSELEPEDYARAIAAMEV